jgi:hypothetical protein
MYFGLEKLKEYWLVFWNWLKKCVMGFWNWLVDGWKVLKLFWTTDGKPAKKNKQK